MAKPDLMAEDRESSRLLVVEVKETISDRDRDFFMQQLRSYADLGRPKTVYDVLVDGRQIGIYDRSSSRFPGRSSGSHSQGKSTT